MGLCVCVLSIVITLILCLNPLLPLSEPPARVVRDSLLVQIDNDGDGDYDIHDDHGSRRFL